RLEIVRSSLVEMARNGMPKPSTPRAQSAHSTQITITRFLVPCGGRMDDSSFLGAVATTAGAVVLAVLAVDAESGGAATTWLLRPESVLVTSPMSCAVPRFSPFCRSVMTQ